MITTHYCILDLETSGLSSTKNAICQIAGIIVDENFNEVDRFDAYVKPYNALYLKKAEKINGLSKEFLNQNGIDLSDALYLIEYHKNLYKVNHFVGHNIRVFDNKFVTQAYKKLGFIMKALTFRNSSFYDTYEMSWKTRIGSYSLENMCKYFNIQYTNKHNAIYDCEATLELFKKLKV